MTDIPYEPFSLPGRLGIVVDPFDDPGFGYVDGFPEITHLGHIRPSVVMLLVDMVGGLLDEIADPHAWHFTTDFNLRMFDGPPAKRVEAHAQRLRLGKSSSVVEMDLTDGTDRSIGYSQIGFARKELRPEDPPKPALGSGDANFRRTNIDRPLLEAAGVLVPDAALGHAEVELADSLRQPAGLMQGGMVAMMLEVGAVALAEHDSGRPRRVVDLDLRYLAGAKVGPMWTQARWLGDPATGWIRVELRDRGVDDRITTTAMARVEP
jgi:acyl-coenzyme A thioesterase PaaI-like protein